MSSTNDFEEKLNIYKRKIENEDFEGALNIIESLSSLIGANDLEDTKINLAKKFLGKLINDDKFDEAISKIDVYKTKYWKYKEDFIKFESLAYFKLAQKENEEDKIDSALKHLEISSSLDSDNEYIKLLIIQILITKKKLYDQALQRISKVEGNISKENINTLKNLKACALNNKAMNLYENNKEDNIEESLNLLNQSIKVKEDESVKKNRLQVFSNSFIIKIIDKKYEEIPKLFEMAKGFKYKSKEMEDFLDINQHISDFCDCLYICKFHTKETYEKSLFNFLEYIRKGINDEEYDVKYKILKINFSDNIEKDSNLFLRQESNICEVLIDKINNYIKRYEDNNLYINLKSFFLIKLARIYFKKNDKMAKKLFIELLETKEKEGEYLDLLQVEAYLDLSTIELEEKNYLKGYKNIGKLIKIINKKFEENNLDFEWPNEIITIKINNIKKDCLIGYIEKSLEGEFINLDNYLDELIKFKEEIKNQIPNIESIEEKIKTFQVKYIKRKSANFLEKKNYKKCIDLCDEFILTYACPNYIKREIKYIKLECLKDISDDLIKENKREDYMKLIKQISLLKQEIDSELGIKNNSTDLIDIMLISMNEKAEYFNRNNLYNISENISDLGLQLDPNNINLLTEKSISNSEKGDLNKAIANNDKILSIQSDNLSAKLNKINNISNLGLKDLNKKYIHYLIKIISSTNIINGVTKIIVGRSIDVLIELINKYDNQIYAFFL